MSQVQSASLIPTPVWKIKNGNISSSGQKFNRDLFKNSQPRSNLLRNGSGIEIQSCHQFRSRIPIPILVTKCHQIIRVDAQLPIRSSVTTSKELSISNHSSSNSSSNDDSSGSFPIKRLLKSRNTKVFVPILKSRTSEVLQKKKQDKGIKKELAIKLNEPYLSDIMTQALLAEATYEVHFKCQPLLENRKHLRNKFVDWIISAGRKLKYTQETVHLTVYIIDAFLNIKCNDLVIKGWPLLALAAFHLAAKFEEVRPMRLSVIMQSYAFLREYECYEVNWMEKEILDELRFDICPPTSKFFADLSINSGQIDFPSEHIKRLTLKLTHVILLESLKEYSLTEVAPSAKAKIAIQISTKYLNKLKSLGASLTSQNYDFIGPESIRKCFALFCQAFNRPLKVPTSIIKPASLKNTRRGV